MGKKTPCDRRSILEGWQCPLGHQMKKKTNIKGEIRPHQKSPKKIRDEVDDVSTLISPERARHPGR